MKLANCEHAVIAKEKIYGYLLNMESQDGWSKALFLFRFGYTFDNAAMLENALLEFACTGNVVAEAFRAPFGLRITLEGRLKTPDGRNPFVRVGWMFKSHAPHIPQFITLIPLKR